MFVVGCSLRLLLSSRELARAQARKVEIGIVDCFNALMPRDTDLAELVIYLLLLMEKVTFC